MKKICLLLIALLLLQSCFSYKKAEINPKTMAIGEIYKIERNHKTSKVMYTRNADTAIVVLENGKEKQIPLKDINSVRKRKFSLAKTISLVPITMAALTGLFVYSWSN